MLTYTGSSLMISHYNVEIPVNAVTVLVILILLVSLTLSATVYLYFTRQSSDFKGEHMTLLCIACVTRLSIICIISGLDGVVYANTIEQDPGVREPIDVSTTFYKLLDVAEECSMYQFGKNHFPDYRPESGFGYYKPTSDEVKRIQLHKRVIVMVCLIQYDCMH